MGSTTSQQSAGKYGHRTSSDEVMNDFGSKATGKYVIVTGANCGLGFETARSLAKHGAFVTIACRSKESGDDAVNKIQAETIDAHVSFAPLDLGSISSINAFTAAYKSSGKPLHFLINNAGVAACPKALTSDGLEMQFGVNHIGHYALTIDLLDILKTSGTAKDPSRVVTLSSYAAFLFAPPMGIRFNDLQGRWK